MTDVILTTDELDALKTVIRYAQELVTAIPYITAAGGNVTRQNITVQALATALEGARVVDFENVREYAPVVAKLVNQSVGENGTVNRSYVAVDPNLKVEFKAVTNATPKRKRTRKPTR